MNVPKTWGDVFGHTAENCYLNKRPVGCAVCNHDSKNCIIENCALCQKKAGMPFDPQINYTYPDK